MSKTFDFYINLMKYLYLLVCCISNKFTFLTGYLNSFLITFPETLLYHEVTKKGGAHGS